MLTDQLSSGKEKSKPNKLMRSKREVLTLKKARRSDIVADFLLVPGAGPSKRPKKNNLRSKLGSEQFIARNAESRKGYTAICAGATSYGTTAHFTESTRCSTISRNQEKNKQREKG